MKKANKMLIALIVLASILFFSTAILGIRAMNRIRAYDETVKREQYIVEYIDEHVELGKTSMNEVTAVLYQLFGLRANEDYGIGLGGYAERFRIYVTDDLNIEILCPYTTNRVGYCCLMKDYLLLSLSGSYIIDYSFH